MRLLCCLFCSAGIRRDREVKLLRNDLKIFRYCGVYCLAQTVKKKNSRKKKSKEAPRETARNELVIYPSFEFVKRRHVPVKFNRELWAMKIKAMKADVEMRQRHSKNYIMQILSKEREVEWQRNVQEVQRNISLIRSSAAGLNQRQAQEGMEIEPETFEVIDAEGRKQVIEAPVVVPATAEMVDNGGEVDL